MDQTEFTSKIEAVMNNRPVIRDNQINYSVGYAHGAAQDESTLRNLFILDVPGETQREEQDCWGVKTSCGENPARKNVKYYDRRYEYPKE